jgi:hypothetical protein
MTITNELQKVEMPATVWVQIKDGTCEFYMKYILIGEVLKRFDRTNIWCHIY